MTTKQEENYIIYRWKWDFFGKVQLVGFVPIHLDLELNSNCNYTCIMCPFHGNRQVETISMPFDMVKKVIDQFSYRGGDSIKFVYRGEPMLYKDLTKAIKYAKDKGIIDTIVNTNGMLLNKDISYELMLAGLDKLVFSIDSRYRETYEKIRRGGDFNKVLQNLIAIQTQKQFCGSETPLVRVQCLVQDLNEEEVKNGEFEKFWSDYADEILINPNCMEHERTDAFGPTPEFRCESVYRRITIRANGDIALCCGIDSDDKILGNIESDTIEEVWRGKKMNDIRKLIYSGKAHLVPACRICDLRRQYHEKEYEIINPIWENMKPEHLSVDLKDYLCEGCQGLTPLRRKRCKKCGKLFCEHHINNHRCK